jgi:hypothetical protein
MIHSALFMPPVCEGGAVLDPNLAKKQLPATSGTVL